ncbi:hypothetical protein BDM02DRAFT_3187530 [Thelephora ganbajun]|uniref:Uncharacterized protein n=1 Tax=Thelephora ganbajun TaxID=370292 RepID=A0ACB6ZEH7_THEGA|nr:hypothetical protein BDM02DRAFT_3187530 [Thelephora ganbajun]
MVKAVLKKRKTKERSTPETHNTPPRWRILPPEIIHIIVELLKHDQNTLRACSLAAREFSHAALAHIGRHITVNHVSRIKQCTQLLTARSAFQHVCSLDLGVTSKSSNPEGYLEEQLTILEIFAQRQTLTCLWLSNMPFPSIKLGQRERIRGIVTTLGSTVNNLGLYWCRFPSYVDMISFIRAFPHCKSLYVRDCVATGENTSGDMFSGLLEYKISLDVLELTSASSDELILDVSSLIEDAALDVSQLSTLTCSVRSAEQAQCVAMATSASLIHHFQLACTVPGGFQAFFNPIAYKWSLESLTIGPMSHTTNYAFWQDAFQNFPNVPHLKEFIVIYYYPNANAFDMSCWVYFGTLLCRGDIFPRFMDVDIRTTIRSLSLSDSRQRYLIETLWPLMMRRHVTFWGRCE